jgi:hypothetical protein
MEEERVIDIPPRPAKDAPIEDELQRLPGLRWGGEIIPQDLDLVIEIGRKGITGLDLLKASHIS